MPLAKKKTRSKKTPTKVENINRGLMNTVRNTERAIKKFSSASGAKFTDNQYNSNFNATKVRGPKGSFGQRWASQDALKKSIKTQSKAAKKATKAAKRK